MSRTLRRSLFALVPAALLLASAWPALAAEPKTPRPVSALKVPARATDPAAKDATGETLPSGQVVFQVLLAEIALQRGDLELSSKAWADLAVRTRDPRALERAVEIAGYTHHLDDALTLARTWVEVEPSSLRAQQMLAGVLVVGNRFDELTPLLARMLAEDPAAITGNLLALNRLLARSPDRVGALRLVERLTAPYDALAEAHYVRAMAASTASAPELALTEARRALAIRPDWDLAALLEAQLLSRESNTAAVASLERFVARNPDANDARLYLARAQIGEGRYADARQNFDRLLKVAPDNPETVFPAAILALQQDDANRADTLLRHLLTLDFPDKSVVRYYLGQIAEQRQQDAEALAFYQSVGVGEQYLPARLRMARLLATGGKLDEALRQLREIKTRNAAEQVQIAEVEAQFLRDANRAQEAFDVLSRVLARQPENPELLYETSLLAEKVGRLELVEKYLRKLIELKPDSAQAYNALGYSFADRGIRLGEARQLIERALVLAPDDPFILDSLGWVLYQQGDLAGALSSLERAYGLRRDPEIAAHLGEVLWKLDRREDARRIWQEAQHSNPGNDALAAAVKRFLP
ncbi:tetratricopeptide repeat protein [Rhodocyclus gracilis]|uniref:Tetratricopeptide repeat protein n=1 Tax=Rhodocyclus tenuis TaxID=1066 RepID=A0A6L5JY20_RHOTE|nr:tetratricopeptide repeat protein [Rhodocyclus gracilis]MQY52223.1 tetratricopeptide repeat protein [Rhodocyclus gracilis]